jgi:hypothetical protein
MFTPPFGARQAGFKFLWPGGLLQAKIAHAGAGAGGASLQNWSAFSLNSTLNVVSEP